VSASEANPLSSKSDAIASDRDAIASAHAVITSAHDAITSAHDAIASAHDVIASAHDVIASERDAITSAHDVIASADDGFRTEIPSRRPQTAAASRDTDARGVAIGCGSGKTLARSAGMTRGGGGNRARRIGNRAVSLESGGGNRT
jgi:hypothetical protein